MRPADYSFTRYLAAKKSVDDRALNRVVWQTLVENLPDSGPDKPLKVLEVGAGIGTMIERALDWGLLSHAGYTAIDSQGENIAVAHRRLKAWAAGNGYNAKAVPGGLEISRDGKRVAVELEAIDLYDFVAREAGNRHWDLLIAHAFLDLIDLPTTLSQLFALLGEGGLFYFTINFDGVSVLQPEMDGALDEKILGLYHRTMDERTVAGKKSGHSRSGRGLFEQITRAGGRISQAGASDWVVYPSEGSYPFDEAYFLHFILHTIHEALSGHPELEAGQLDGWIACRHTQIERAGLVYIAHQLDFVGEILAPIAPN
jgi:hypothetical protein